VQKHYWLHIPEFVLAMRCLTYKHILRQEQYNKTEALPKSLNQGKRPSEERDEEEYRRLRQRTESLSTSDSIQRPLSQTEKDEALSLLTSAKVLAREVAEREVSLEGLEAFEDAWTKVGAVLRQVDRTVRRTWEKHWALYPVHEEDLRKHHKTSDVRCALDQYVRHVSALVKRPPNFDDCLELLHLQSFHDAYRTNNGTSPSLVRTGDDAQAKASSSIFNKMLYLKGVFAFVKNNPELFSEQRHRQANSCWSYLQTVIKPLGTRRKLESSVSNQLETQRLELWDLGLDERRWLTNLISVEVNRVGQLVENKGRLSPEQCHAFVYW